MIYTYEDKNTCIYTPVNFLIFFLVKKKPMHLCLSNQYQHFTYAICFSDKSKTNQTNTVKKINKKKYKNQSSYLSQTENIV